MDQPTQSNSEINFAKAVYVEFRDGRWVVCISDDSDTYVREFVLEAHAAEFADSQRMRLGIFVP